MVSIPPAGHSSPPAEREAVHGIEGCRSQADAEWLIAWHRSPAGRAQRAPGLGLVRSATRDTPPTDRLTIPEENRVRRGKQRALRLYKSISCAGDLLRSAVDEKGRRLGGIFLTLTYRPDVYWAPGQIKRFLQHVRQWCDRRGVVCRVVWVAEQHKSGRVHYHAIFFLPRGLSLPKPDKQGWWPHGLTRIERCRKLSVGYLIKYATKCHDIARPWPVGMRLHGHGGLTAADRVRRAWWVLPRYIRQQCDDWMRVRRAQGGGWMSPVTGEWWRSWKPPCVLEIEARAV